MLITAGARVDTMDTEGDMPHHLAASNNSPAVLGLLLDAGADVAAGGTNPPRSARPRVR